MTSDNDFSAFYLIARTFLRQAIAAADEDRTMKLIESPRGAEKFCFAWSSIDSRPGETTVEFSFRQMSPELSSFLSGPLTEVLRESYRDSQFWLIHRERKKSGKLNGCYEQISFDEALQNIGRQLVIFDDGHAWIYLSDDGSRVGLAQTVARKIKA